jgi:hypothetical protein
MPLMGPRIGRPGVVGTVARTAVIAGTASAVSGRVQRRQQARFAEKDQQAYYEQRAAAEAGAPPPPPPAPPAGGVTDDSIEKLKQLAELHQQGVLTDEEFAAQKAKLLA